MNVKHMDPQNRPWNAALMFHKPSFYFLTSLPSEQILVTTDSHIYNMNFVIQCKSSCGQIESQQADIVQVILAKLLKA